MNKDLLKILFIGNSHTYFNNMPELVAERFREHGIKCEATMIAHGGWYLEQHLREPEVKFNIFFGHYDYVVLQEYSHPMTGKEKYASAASELCDMIHASGAASVIYATWAMKNEPEKQDEMNEINREVAGETASLLAPVGEHWQKHIKENSDINLYYKDGAHASESGSALAADVIFHTIIGNIAEKSAEK